LERRHDSDSERRNQYWFRLSLSLSCRRSKCRK
jgi:hypothetical protein